MYIEVTSRTTSMKTTSEQLYSWRPDLIELNMNRWYSIHTCIPDVRLRNLNWYRFVFHQNITNIQEEFCVWSNMGEFTHTSENMHSCNSCKKLSSLSFYFFSCILIVTFQCAFIYNFSYLANKPKYQYFNFSEKVSEHMLICR